LILIDTNFLLYAYHPRAAHHARSRAWLESMFAGPGLVRFSWLTLRAFLRIGTSHRVFDRPLSTAEAEAAISTWLAQPAAGILEPGRGTGTSFAPFCARARPAARLSWMLFSPRFAIEHGATICSTDRDFARFPGVKWIKPIAGDGTGGPND